MAQISEIDTFRASVFLHSASLHASFDFLITEWSQGSQTSLKGNLSLQETKLEAATPLMVGLQTGTVFLLPHNLLVEPVFILN